MTANSEKAKFYQNTRRFYQHLRLSRRLHGLIREMAPRYGSAGQELMALLSRYEFLVDQTASSEARKAGGTIELTKLPQQMHQKLYALMPHLGAEKHPLIHVMQELEALHPHLYKQSEFA